MSDYNDFQDDSLPLFSAVNASCIIPSRAKPSFDKHSVKLLEILKELEARDLTCVEVESRWHRGQAAIGQLRESGYVIHTEGQSYHYTGEKQQMHKVPKSLQDKYYESNHWRQMSRERKEFDGWRCVQCRSTEGLETHHWRYDLFSEHLDQLTTLCKKCHDNTHALIKGSGVHFPRYVTKSIADRIEAGE